MKLTTQLHLVSRLTLLPHGKAFNLILQGRYALYSPVEWCDRHSWYSPWPTLFINWKRQSAVGGGSVFISRIRKVWSEFYCNLSMDPPALAIHWGDGIL